MSVVVAVAIGKRPPSSIEELREGRDSWAREAAEVGREAAVMERGQAEEAQEGEEGEEQGRRGELLVEESCVFFLVEVEREKVSDRDRLLQSSSLSSSSTSFLLPSSPVPPPDVDDTRAPRERPPLRSPSFSEEGSAELALETARRRILGICFLMRQVWSKFEK